MVGQAPPYVRDLGMGWALANQGVLKPDPDPVPAAAAGKKKAGPKPRPIRYRMAPYIHGTVVGSPLMSTTEP
jgi:hypothetical protein